jgi:hypothetical protein
LASQLAVELWPGDGVYIRLVSSPCPVRVAVIDLEHLMAALAGALDELAKAAGMDLGATTVAKRSGQDEAIWQVSEERDGNLWFVQGDRKSSWI